MRVQKGLAAWHQAKDSCRLIGRHTCTASLRRSHVQHDNARVPRRTPFWPKPQKGAKALFPVHPAASMNEPPAPTGSDRLPPKAACCKPVHARSPAASGRLFCRLPPVGRQYSGVGRPTCGAPDAAESVERNPFLLMRPACAIRLSPLTSAADAPPASATCFGGYRQLIDNVPASAGLT